MMKHLQSIKAQIKTEQNHHYKAKPRKQTKITLSHKKKSSRRKNIKKMQTRNNKFHQTVIRSNSTLNLRKTELNQLTKQLPFIDLKTEKTLHNFRNRKDVLYSDRPYLIKNEKIENKQNKKICKSLQKIQSRSRKFSLIPRNQYKSMKLNTAKKLPKMNLDPEKNSIFDLKEDSKIGKNHVKMKMDFTGLNWKKPLHLYDPELETPEELEKINRKISKETVHALSLRKPSSVDYGFGFLDFVWKKCNVEGVVGDRMYVISWLQDGKFKVVGRMNLIFEWEEKVDFILNREQAKKVRYEMIYYELLKKKIESQEFSRGIKVFYPVRTGEKIFNRLRNITHGNLDKIGKFMTESQEIFHFKIHEFMYIYKINKKILKKFFEWFDENIFKKISYDEKKPKRFMCEEISEEAPDDDSLPILQVRLIEHLEEKPTINFLNLLQKNIETKKNRNTSTVIKFYYKKQKNFKKISGCGENCSLIESLRKMIYKNKNLDMEGFKVVLKVKIENFYLKYLNEEFFERNYSKVLMDPGKDKVEDLKDKLTQLLNQQDKIKKEIKDMIVDKLYQLPNEDYFKNLRYLTDYCKNLIIAKMSDFAISLNRKMKYFLDVYSLSSPIPFIDKNYKSGVLKFLEPSHRKRAIEIFKKLKPKISNDMKSDLDRIFESEYFNSGNNFENDRNLLKNCIMSLLNCNLDFSKTYRILKRSKAGRFEIKFSVNQNLKFFSKLSKEKRKKFILYSRNFIYNYRENDHKVIKDSILEYLSSTSNSKSVNIRDTKILGNELFNNGKLLGWLNFDNMLLRPGNHLVEFVTGIMKLFTNHLSHLSIYKPINFIEIEEELKDIKIELNKEELVSYLKLCQDIAKYSLIGLFSLVFILDKFKHIFIPKKLYVDTILSFSYDKKSTPMDMINYSNFIMKEVDLLKKDRKFIAFKVRDEYSFGFFKINLKKFKKICISKIDDIIKGFYKKATQKFLSSIKVFTKMIIQIKSQIKIKPGSLEEFIRIKNRIKSDEFEDEMEKLQRINSFIQTMLKYLDKLQINYEAAYFLISLDCKTSLKFVRNQCKKVNQNLKVSKFEFYDEVMLYIKEVFTEFEQINDQLDLYEQIRSPDNPKNLAKRAKELYSMIVKLISKSERVQNYQKELEIKITNFDQIKSKAKRFKKFVDLWNFFELWEKSYKSWLDRPIRNLRIDEIKKVIEEGQTLLKQLYEFFSDNEAQKNLAMIYTRKINTFRGQYMDILKVILHPAFNERHWNSLLTEVYFNKKIPDLNDLTINILSLAGIRNHKSLIEILNKKAISEYSIDQKIKSVEQSLINMNFKPMSLGSKQNFTIMVKTNEVLSQLMHHKLSTQKMMNDSEHLELFLDDIFRILNTIQSIEKILSRMVKIQEILLETKNFKKYCKLKLEFTEKENQKYSDSESEFLFWMDELRSKGFRFILELSEEEMSDKSDNLITSLDSKIQFLQEKIKRKLITLFNNSRKMNPRLYYITLKEAGDILLEMANVRFQPVTFSKLFPEIKAFGFESDTSIDNFRVDKHSTYKMKSCNLFSKTPLKDLKGTISNVNDAIEEEMVRQSNLVIEFFSNYPFEYQRFWNVNNMRELDIQTTCATLKAIFFFDFCFMLSALDEQKIQVKDIPGRLESYKDQINSSLRKLNYMKFSSSDDKNSSYTTAKMDIYLLCLKNIDDYLDLILEEKCFKLDSYRWFSTPKHSLVLNTAAFPKEVDSSIFLKKGLEKIQYHFEESKLIPNMLKLGGVHSLLSQSKVKLSLNIYDFVFEYGYRSFNFSGNLMEFTLTDRLNHQILISLGQKEITLIKGFSKSGKGSSAKVVSSLVGRYMVKWNCSSSHSHDSIINTICATVGSGAWILLSNLEELQYKELSVLSTFISEIRGIIKQKSLQVNFMNQKFFEISKGSHILGTLNIGKSDSIHNKNPIFIENFRCCCLTKFDYSEFIFHFLADLAYTDKFNIKKIRQLSKRLLLLFHFMTYSMSDKLFLVENSISLFNLSDYVNDKWKFDLNYKSVKFFLKQLKRSFKRNKTGKSISEIIFSVFYHELRLKISKEKMKNFSFTFNTIFKDNSNSFIQDFSYENHFPEDVPNLKEFCENNKISHEVANFSFTKLRAIPKKRKKTKNFILYGEGLFFNFDLYSKLILYFNNEILQQSKKMVEINIDVLDKEDLFGDKQGRFLGVLHQLFSEKLYQMYGAGIKQKMSTNSIKFPCLEFTFSTVKKIEIKLKDTEIESGDLIIFKNFNKQDSHKIESLMRINEDKMHCSNNGIIKLEEDLKFIFCFEDLKNLSPSLTSANTVIFLEPKSRIIRENLRELVLPQLELGKSWYKIFETTLSAFESNIMKQIVVYMKHLDITNSLTFWLGETQFMHSIGYKITACFQLLEKIFSLESDKKESEENRRVVVRSYIEAIILNCIICEIEIYLKPQLKLRASQFFVDTLFSYRERKKTDESSSDSSLSKENENSDSSFIEEKMVEEFIINEKFAQKFCEFHDKYFSHNSTVFSFTFDILKGEWIFWEDLQIHPLRLLKNNSFLKKMGFFYKRQVKTSPEDRYRELCHESNRFTLSGFYDSNTKFKTVFVKSIIKSEYWSFILHTIQCKIVLMAFNRLSKKSIIESLKKVKHMGDSDYVSINANHVNSKKNLREFLFKRLKNSKTPLDLVVDDLHLGRNKMKFESVINEINQRQIFFNYLDTYWKSNVKSTTVGVMIPQISNSSVFLKTRQKYKSIIKNSSMVLIPTIEGRSIERLFVAEIPKTILTQDMVLFAARIGKIYHNMTPYLKFVQNNLGCNLSVEIWLKIVRNLSRCQIRKSSFTYKLLTIKNIFEELFEGQWKNLNLNLMENQSEVSARSFESSFNFSNNVDSLPSSETSNSFTESSVDQFDFGFDELASYKIPTLEKVISSRLKNEFDPRLSKISRYKMSAISTRKKPSILSLSSALNPFDGTKFARNSRLIGRFGGSNHLMPSSKRSSFAPTPNTITNIMGPSSKNKPLESQDDILNVVECEEFLDDSDWYMKIGGGYIESFEMIQAFVIKFKGIISKNIMNSEDSEVLRTIRRASDDYELYNIKVETNSQIKDDFTPYIKLNKLESGQKISKKLLEILEDVMVKNLKTQRYEEQKEGLLGRLNLDNDPFNERKVMREFVDKNIIEVVNIEYSYLFSYVRRLSFLLDLPNTNLVLGNDNQILNFISFLSCKMIHRLHFLILYRDFVDLTKVQENLEKCLDLIILEDEKVTFIIEYDNRLKFSDYDELIQVIEIFQSSENIFFIGNKKLEKYVTKMRKKAVYKQVGLKDLFQVMKSKIRKSFNVVIRVPSKKLQETSRYLMLNHSSFYFKTIFRTLKELPYSDEFSPLNKLLLKKLLDKEDKSLHLEFSEIYFEKDSNNIKNSMDKLKFYEEKFYSEIWQKNFSIRVLEEMVDFAMIVKIFKERYSSSKMKIFKSIILGLIKTNPDKESVQDIRYYNELGDKIHKKMEGINIMKILKYEKIFSQFFKSSFKLIPQQINLISSILFLLSLKLNFIICVYDPFEIFKHMSPFIKKNFSDLKIDENSSSRTTLKHAAQAGKHAIVIVQKLTEDDQSFLKDIIRHFILLRFGVIYGFFKNLNQQIDFVHGNEKFKISPNFRMSIIFERRIDIRNFLKEIEEIGLRFLRIMAFNDNIGFMLKDCSVVYDFIKREQRIKKAIYGLKEIWRDKNPNEIVDSMKFGRMIFKLNDILIWKKLKDSKKFNQSDSHEGEENFTFEDISKMIKGFKLSKDSYEKKIEITEDINLSFKVRGGMMQIDMFESNREVKFMHPLCKDTTAIYMKILSFNDLVLKGKLDPNTLSELFVMSFNIMKIEIDKDFNKKASLLRKKISEKSKKKNVSKKEDERNLELFDFDFSERLNYSVFNSRIIYQINAEHLDLWNELMIYFVDQFSKSLNTNEKNIFWLWLWLNHSNFGATNYKKENEDINFSPLRSRLGSNNSSLGVSKIGKYYQRKNSKFQIDIEGDENSDIIALFSDIASNDEYNSISSDRIIFGFDVMSNKFNLSLIKIFSNMTLSKKDKRFVEGNPFKKAAYIFLDSLSSESPKKDLRDFEDFSDLVGERMKMRKRIRSVTKKSGFARFAKKRIRKPIKEVTEDDKKDFELKILKDIEPVQLERKKSEKISPDLKMRRNKNLRLPSLSINTSNESEEVNCSISSKEIDISKIPNAGNNVAFISFSRYDIDLDKSSFMKQRNKSKVVSPMNLKSLARRGDRNRRINVLTSLQNSPGKKKTLVIPKLKEIVSINHDDDDSKDESSESDIEILDNHRDTLKDKKLSRFKAYFRKPSIEHFNRISNIKVPDVLKVKIRRILDDKAYRNAIYLYKRVKKAKNFEKYELLFQQLISYSKLWAKFYKRSLEEIFNDKNKIILPIEDKHLTSSIKPMELANWLFFTKPFVLKKYLTSIPSVNNYQFSERAYFNMRTVVMNKSSEFINLFYEEEILINPVQILVSALASRYKSEYNQVDNSNHGYINFHPCLIISDFKKFAKNTQKNFELYEEVFSERRTIIVDDFDQWKISEKIGFRALIEQLNSKFKNVRKTSMSNSSYFPNKFDRVQKIIMVHNNRHKAKESYFKGQSIYVSKPQNLKEVMMRLNCISSGIYINKLLNKKKCENFEKMEFLRKERDNHYYTDLRLKKAKFSIRCDILREFSNFILKTRGKKVNQEAQKLGAWGNPLRLTYVVFFMFGVSILKYHNIPAILEKSFYLTAQDISLIKSTWEKIITVVLQNPKTVTKILIENFFPTAVKVNTEARLFMPFVCSEELLKLYNKNLKKAFDQNEREFEISGKVYKLKIDQMIVDHFDLMEIINLFPQSDPNSILGLTPHEKKKRDVNGSKEYYSELKSLFKKNYLKLNFSENLNPISHIGVGLRNQIAENEDSTDLLNLIIQNCEHSKIFNIVILFPKIIIDNILLFKKYDNLSRQQKFTSQSTLKTLSSFKDEKFMKPRRSGGHRSSKLYKFRNTLNRRFSNSNIQGFTPRDSYMGSNSNLRFSNEVSEFSVNRKKSITVTNPENGKKFEFLNLKGGEETKKRFMQKSDFKMLRRKRMFHSFLLEELIQLNKIGEQIREDFLIAYELLTGELSYEFSSPEDREMIKVISENKLPNHYKDIMKNCFDRIEGKKNFTNYWENLIEKLNYTNNLQNSPDAMPSTGCYNLSKVFNPFSLIMSLAFAFAYKQQKPLEDVQFHGVFYSDFDIGDLDLRVLRINGFKLVNAMFDEDGMLVEFEEHEEKVYHIPQLVIMPYFEQKHISEKTYEKAFDIALRKNKNRTASLKSLSLDPLIINKFDNDRYPNNDYQKSMHKSKTGFDKFYLVKLPIYLEESCLNDEMNSGRVRVYLCVDSFKPQEYWNEKFAYVTL